MRYIQEFRSAEAAEAILARINQEICPTRDYHLMEFCGGHTHTIFRYGLIKLLPNNIKFIHGPGCPVCVLPMGRLDGAITLAKISNAVLVTYGDVLRVPSSGGRSLLTAKAEGLDIRMVYSCAEALGIARDNPNKEIIFFAIGFETTTPATAVILQSAAREELRNFSVYCNHLVTPAALTHLLESPELRKMDTFRLDGFIGPAHVSTVIGSQPFEYFAQEFQKPIVIAGFEPLDVAQAVLMLVRQLNEGRAMVENQFSRVVTRDGNSKAKQIVAEVFELQPSFEWRGLGVVPYSALRIKADYVHFDAEKRFGLETFVVQDPRGCECGAIIRGIKKPTDCKLFGRGCTPNRPIGSCMVSSEGACGAYFRFEGDR